MSTIELSSQIDTSPLLQEQWLPEHVHAHVDSGEYAIEPPLTLGESAAITGLLNRTHPLTREEDTIRWEIVMASEPGHEDPRYLALNAVWKTLRTTAAM